ncbi:MAG: C40 family peptidase [Marmoricola sp.]
MQEAGLAEELTRAENISAGLARQRHVGLARQAAQRAAEIEKARQSDERLSAPAESGPDSNRPESNQADSDKAAADDAPPVVADPPPAGSGVSAALNYARSKLGLPYRWGASGPSSFDCSGLTMMAWRAGGKSLPHYSAAQYSASTPISRAALRPGDLVFWGSSPRSIHHVALYIGNGQILHAPRTGQPVRVDSIDYWIAPRYFGRP